MRIQAILLALAGGVFVGIACAAPADCPASDPRCNAEPTIAANPNNNTSSTIETTSTIDNTPVEVVSTQPSHNSSGVSLNLGQISLVFTTEMDITRGTAALSGSPSSALGAAEWTSSGTLKNKRVSFQVVPFGTDLSYDTTHTVTFTDFASADGRPLNLTASNMLSSTGKLFFRTAGQPFPCDGTVTVASGLADRVWNATVYQGSTTPTFQEQMILPAGYSLVAGCTNPDKFGLAGYDGTTAIPANASLAYPFTVSTPTGTETWLVNVTSNPAPTAAPFARIPLQDVFTGANCGPCIAADWTAEKDKEAHPEMIVLGWHMSIPSYDEWSFHEFEMGGVAATRGTAPEWIRQRGYLSDITSFYTPIRVGNGTDVLTASAAPYSSTYPAGLLTQTSDLSIQVIGVVTGTTAIVKATFFNRGAADVTLPLNLVIMENGIDNKPSYVTYSSGNILVFDDVVRQYDQKAVSTLIPVGQSTREWTVQLSNKWFAASSGQEVVAVVWAQKAVEIGQPNEGTAFVNATYQNIYKRQVEQAAEAHLENF
jgi:hypothetical protein